jgi:hypothetical protein
MISFGNVDSETGQKIVSIVAIYIHSFFEFQKIASSSKYTNVKPGPITAHP